jgi:hypothetical protein
MQRGWQILSALRSDSREWPRRIGVAGGAEGAFAFALAEEEVVKGLGKGGEGGERRRRICSWT